MHNKKYMTNNNNSSIHKLCQDIRHLSDSEIIDLIELSFIYGRRGGNCNDYIKYLIENKREVLYNRRD